MTRLMHSRVPVMQHFTPSRDNQSMPRVHVHYMTENICRFWLEVFKTLISIGGNREDCVLC